MWLTLLSWDKWLEVVQTHLMAHSAVEDGKGVGSDRGDVISVGCIVDNRGFQFINYPYIEGNRQRDLKCKIMLAILVTILMSVWRHCMSPDHRKQA